MKSCLKIKYSAVKWNNYQGGQGETFFAETLVTPYEGAKIDSLMDIAEGHLIEKIKSQFVGEVNIISIKLMPIHKSTPPTDIKGGE